jgi:mono/diheme cytochrome c family protein
MIIRNASWCLLIAVIAAAAAGMAAKTQTGSQANQEASNSERQRALIRSVDGVDLYRAYCASCHGKDGNGNGPMASELKATVPDLTVIAKDNGGQFPVARVRRIIIGEGMIASHGSREMPVWGPIFHQIESDVDWGNVRIENLVRYLESIQAIRPSHDEPGGKASAENVPSGEQLYKQLCASCHGNDLKGNGPAPSPFKDFPPDLTLLAKRHGGKFPDEYVSEVLRNDVVLKAHGPPEMPTWGADFRSSYHLSEAQVTLRITNLSNFINSRQAQ